MSTQNYGTVQHNDITITLTQQAYLQSNGNDNWYQAAGIDADDNDYLIKWEITNPDAEDESDACDWTQYEVIEL